ncbi:MAG: O-antigen ligase family protein [Armatimonadetes bacterium]|nr:O-antigen ligase family protein [Armatimonadota bacterium]
MASRRIWAPAASVLVRIGGSPLAQSIARLRVTRVLAAAISFTLQVIVFGAWRLLKRAWRWVRGIVKKYEITGWVLTVIASAGLAGVLFMQPVYLKLLLGAIGLLAYALITFSRPLVGLLIWLITSLVVGNFFQIKFMPGTPVVTADRLFMMVMLAAMLAEAKRSQEFPKLTLLHLAMFLFIGTMLLATFASQKPRQAAQSVMDSYLMPILVYLFARRWVSNRNDLRLVFVSVILVGVYLAGFGIPEYLTHKNLFRIYGTAWQELELGAVRVQGPARSPQEFGMVVAAAWFLAVIRAADPVWKQRRVLYWILAVMMGFAMLYTLRRSIYVGWVLGTAVLLFGSRDFRRIMAPVIVFGAIAVAAFWGPITSHPIVKGRVTSVTEMYGRAIVYTTSVQIIKENPLFGIGVQNYGERAREYLRPYGDIMPHHGARLTSPHNSYLKIAVEGGALAFVPFVAMLVGMLAYSVTAYRRAPPGVLGKGFVLAFWALAAGHLSQALTTDAFFFCPYLSALYFLMFGCIAGAYLRPEPAAEVALDAAGGAAGRFPRKARPAPVRN